jgi:uncharacterized protein (DUF1015 family)
MAIVAPFRGVRYNPEKFDSLDVTVAQPYDKITDEMRERYYAASDYNIARIIKGRTAESDSESDNQYTRARGFYEAWLSNGVLVRDAEPAVYAYDQEYNRPDTGTTATRQGYIAALELTEFSEGVVLPHEKTLSGPKMDRLNLLRATQTHMGQIFMLYPDQANTINNLLAAHRDRAPDIEAKDDFGDTHRVWGVTDQSTLAKIREEMKPKFLVIADGHHRYETALNYRNEMRDKLSAWSEEDAFNWVMVTLVGMEDPGLVILPTHRVMHSLSSKTASDVVEDAREFFEAEEVGGKDELVKTMAEAAFGAKQAVGLYGDGKFWVLTLKTPAVLDRFVEADRALEYKLLDVTVLHSILIEHVLGLSKESVARQDNIAYIRSLDEAIEMVDSGKAEFAFLLNATRIEQVKTIARKRERMPQKSTDFFPKLITGLVMCPVEQGEKIR